MTRQSAEENDLDASLMRNRSPGKPDGFRIRYTLLLLACLLSVQLSGISKGPYDSDGLGILMALTYALTLPLYFVVVVAASAFRRYWKRMLFMLVAPALTFGFLQSELYTGFDPQYVKLLLARLTYMEQVRQAKGGDASFYTWLWDQSWGVYVTTNRTLSIYDETDQILLAPEARSVEWINRVLSFTSPERLDLTSITDPLHYSVRHENPYIRRLAAHFYVVNEAN